MRLRITLTGVLLGGLTLALVAVGGILSLIAMTSWTIDHPHVATRSIGFAAQLIDRDSTDGSEVRILEFACPGTGSQKLSLNQVSRDELLLVTCDGHQVVTTIPWWFPLTFGNLPALPFKAERSDESLRWQDRA